MTPHPRSDQRARPRRCGRGSRASSVSAPCRWHRDATETGMTPVLSAVWRRSVAVTVNLPDLGIAVSSARGSRHRQQTLDDGKPSSVARTRGRYRGPAAAKRQVLGHHGRDHWPAGAEMAVTVWSATCSGSQSTVTACGGGVPASEGLRPSTPAAVVARSASRSTRPRRSRRACRRRPCRTAA